MTRRLVCHSIQLLSQMKGFPAGSVLVQRCHVSPTPHDLDNHLQIYAYWLIGGRLLTVLLSRNADGAASPAEAILERTEWDLGDIDAGPTLHVKFPVTNSGGRRLILHQTERSCECLSGSHPEIIVPAGISADLVARVETAHLSGPMRLELYYSTNDPQRRKIALIVLANVSPRGAESEAPLEPIAEM